MTNDVRSIRIMAVASAGGHWVQLFRMRQAWNGFRVHYVTTRNGYRAEVLADARARNESRPGYWVVPEANRWQKLKLVYLFVNITALVFRLRPHMVISTGAAPGYLALRLAGLLGARTIWIDSIANAEELSMSGQRIGRHADVWLTQWEHLSSREGPEYWGSVV